MDNWDDLTHVKTKRILELVMDNVAFGNISKKKFNSLVIDYHVLKEKIDDIQAIIDTQGSQGINTVMVPVLKPIVLNLASVNLWDQDQNVWVDLGKQLKMLKKHKSNNIAGAILKAIEEA